MSDPATEHPYTHGLEVEECLNQYGKGGFLCVQLDQYLQRGRYHILRKLGRGSYATVWLAYDRRDLQWVSIKILRADENARSKELEHHLKIKQALHIPHLSSVKIVHLIGHFRHRSINGVHQCLVFELLGPSVYHSMSSCVEAEIYPEYDDAGEIFGMVVPMLQGIVALHRAGYAWGDPSPSNLAYTFPKKDLSRQQVLEVIGPGYEIRPSLLDGNNKVFGEGVPASLVTRAQFPDWPMEDYQDDFRILDLGNAFPITARKRDHQQCRRMQPPESIFEEVGYETDLWGAGMLICYFIFAHLPRWGSHDADRIQDMIDYNGPIPQRWHAQMEGMKPHLQPREAGVKPGSVLREKFVTSKHHPDVKLLLPIVQGLIRLEPEARDSAKYALDNVIRICKSARNSDLRELVPKGYQYG